MKHYITVWLNRVGSEDENLRAAGVAGDFNDMRQWIC